MQGYSHALTGAAAWLAVTSTSDAALTWYDASPGVALAGSVLCAGAALLPDLDHPDGTIAHSLPGVTSPLARAVASLTGGHRHGTHSLLGIAAFTGLAWASASLTITVEGRPIAIAAGIYALLLVAFAAKGLGIARSTGLQLRRSRNPLAVAAGAFLASFLGPWIIAAGTAGFVTWQMGYTWDWLALAVGLGAFLHCAGDALTVGGVPWLWPWNPKPPRPVRGAPIVTTVWQPNGYFRLPVLGRTDSAREKVFALVIGGYVAYLVFFEMARLWGFTILV